jgi:hypothetical protein
VRITLRRGKCPINDPIASQRATTLPSLGATGAGWRECGAIGAITGHLEHCVIIAPNSINPGLCPARNDETADPKPDINPTNPTWQNEPSRSRHHRKGSFMCLGTRAIG